MEEKINELNDKIIELESRVNKLEVINKRRIIKNIISTIFTIIFVIVVGIIYVVLISKIYGNYTNMV